MSKSIRIDDDIWAVMKQQAEPLEDTPSDVLRKIFKLANLTSSEALAGEAESEPSHTEPSMKERFRYAIAEVLIEMGGTGKVDQIFNRIESKLKPYLNEHDRKVLKNGQPRWKNTAGWERVKMKEEDLLDKNSPHGEWAVTDKGRAEYAQWCSLNGFTPIAA